MAIVTYGSTPRDFLALALAAPAAGANGSTDILDRGTLRRTGVLSITSAVGAGPSVTVNIVGSVDASFAAGTFWNIPYCLVATPETLAVAALTITTAVTTNYILRQDHPWRFMRLDLTANTNVTLTVSVAA